MSEKKEKTYLIDFIVNDLDYSMEIKAETKAKAKYKAFLEFQKDRKGTKFSEFIRCARIAEREW